MKLLRVSLLFNAVALTFFLFFAIKRLKPRPNITSKKITYWLHRDQLLKNLPTDSNSIVFAGDSNIENYEVAEIFKSHHFKNRGISYDTSLGLLNRINPIIHGKPAALFIQVGINDLLTAVPKANIVGNFEEMIRSVKTKSPYTKMHFLEIVTGNPQRKVEVHGLNASLKSLCERNDIIFIPFPEMTESGFLSPKYDIGDHAHFNTAGFALITRYIKPYLQ